jgi:hypothetical protein
VCAARVDDQLADRLVEAVRKVHVNRHLIGTDELR